MDMLVGANAVHRLLHFAVTTIAPLHGVRGGRKQLVVEKRQGFLQVGGLKLAQDFTDGLESANALTQLGEFRQRGVGAATSIEQAVHFFHDVSQGSELRQATCDLQERSALGRGQVMADEQMAVLEKVRDLLLQSLGLACRSFGFDRGRSAALHHRLSRGQLLANLGHCPQDHLRQFLDDVEFANLVGNSAENRLQRLGIKGRSVGRHAFDRHAPRDKHGLKPAEERDDIRMIWIVVQDLIEQTLEGAVVNDREHAEGTVVQLVGCNVTREISQGPIEVVGVHLCRSFFFPRPRPSSGW